VGTMRAGEVAAGPLSSRAAQRFHAGSVPRIWSYCCCTGGGTLKPPSMRNESFGLINVIRPGDLVANGRGNRVVSDGRSGGVLVGRENASTAPQLSTTVRRVLAWRVGNAGLIARVVGAWGGRVAGFMPRLTVVLSASNENDSRLQYDGLKYPGESRVGCGRIAESGVFTRKEIARMCVLPVRRHTRFAWVIECMRPWGSQMTVMRLANASRGRLNGGRSRPGRRIGQCWC